MKMAGRITYEATLLNNSEPRLETRLIKKASRCEIERAQRAHTSTFVIIFSPDE